MSTSYPVSRPVPVVSRLTDYIELTKPRIAVMAMVAVTVGYLLALRGDLVIGGLLHALTGILLVAASSTVLNQYIERDIDGRMARTAGRPIPSGRLTATEVLWFGLATGVGGVLYLAAFVNLLTAVLAASTLLLYVAVYTPLKTRTAYCTAIGAIPGALPPVLGWTAAGGELNASAFSLFAILFVWQFPHFLAIAWLYRDDYEQAGLRMLPGPRRVSRITSIHAVAYAAVLIPVSLIPGQVSLTGSASHYAFIALLLGLGYLAAALRFLAQETTETARGLLYTSLVYLPLLLLTLTWEHFHLLQ